MRTAFFFLAAALLLYGCANKVTPGGGSKDVTPPRLVSADPENMSVHFESKHITLTFDEYIQFKELSRQLVISPPVDPSPDISIRKKSIVISFTKPLASNTTYVINFGNAIADNHEGNVLQGFTYLFSTGSDIDSISVSGTVASALSLKPVKDAVVILYDAAIADSLWLKSSPAYFSKTGENGTYSIRNIREGRYKLFALDDKNNNYQYDGPDEWAGFNNNILELSDSATINIRLFPQHPLKQSIKKGWLVEPGKLTTVFARPVKNLLWEVTGLKSEKIIPRFSPDRDTVDLFVFPPPSSDTVRVVWKEEGNLLDTVTYLKSRRQPGATSTITGYEFFPARGAALPGELNPFFVWPMPVRDTDTSMIKLEKDSVARPFQLQFADSLHTRMEIAVSWIAGSYSIVLLPGAVTDLYDRKNDTIKVTFNVPAERSRGSIGFKVTAVTGNYLLQLVSEKDEPVRERIITGNITGEFAGVEPGAYRMRLVFDSNNNRLWDTGNYPSGIQPEEIRYYPETIMVRANWEVEIDWSADQK